MMKDKIENFPSLNILKPYLPDCKCCIAGGCFKSILNHEKIKDIDIFFESKNDFQKAIEYYSNNEDFARVFESNNVVCFKNKYLRVDLVKSVYGKPESIISKFDFTVTKFAMFWEETFDEKDVVLQPSIHRELVVIFHPKFFEHLQMKKLVIDADLPFPISTFNRILRYTRYGFMLCRESKLKYLEAVAKAKKEDIALLSKELYESFD